MKKILFPLAFCAILFSTTSVIAQTNQPGITDIFCEDFEDPNPANWGFTLSSVGSAIPFPPYPERLVTNMMSMGASADTIRARSVIPGSFYASYMTTPDFKVDTFTGLNLSFSQICYIENLDEALVEYSFDGGRTYNRVPASAYQGSSGYTSFSGAERFNKTSRPSLWRLGDTNFVWGPNSNGWIREDFNLTNLMNNRPAGSDSMRIRLGYYDHPSSNYGRVGKHIWYVDDFCIRGGNCDLIPPTIVLKTPPDNYPARYEGRVYLAGPWLFDATVTDNKGQVDSVYIVYTVTRKNATNPTAPFDTLITDTIGMNRFPGSNFKGQINANLPNGATISPGDSVFWKVEARDGSSCQNLRQDPPSDYTVFQVRPKLPQSCKTQPIFDYPYYEDFDGQIYQTNNKNLIGLPDADWENVTGDFHQWWTQSGPSSDTGRFRILDDYPGGGKYLYVESSNPNNGTYKDSTAFLLSPCFDFTDLPNGLARFYVNLNTAGIEDSLNVDVFDPTPRTGFPNGRFVEDVIPAIKGNKGSNWLPFEFTTFPFRNTITQFRFSAAPGRDDGLGDIGLDSFKIIPADTIDARLNSILIGPFIPSGTLNGVVKTDSILINVQNLGIHDVNTLDLQYQIIPENPSIPVFTSGNYAWTGNIPPGTNQNIRFPQSLEYIVPLGVYRVKAWLTYPNDSVQPNDTSYANSRGVLIKSGKKYMDDFDTDTIWSVFLENDSLNNQWELGTPNYDFTYSAYTAPNSWDILLNRAYTGTGKTVRLLSPFLDFTNVDDAIISFINNRDIDTTRDGMFVEYSLNRGLTWDSVISTGDPKKLKWYNSFLSSGGFGGNPVFSGTTYCFGNTWNGFLESELLLPPTFNYQPEVLLRFNFFAEDDDDGNDGISIDNILVYDPEPLDLQVQHYLSPTSRCALSATQRIKTIVKNRGLNTVNTFSMEYTITHIPTGAVEVKSDVINRTIAHRDTIHVTSQSTFNMFNYGDYDVKVKAILPNDQCSLNDSIVKMVEHVEGCSLQFYIETSRKPNVQLPCDSSVWRFTYTSGGRNYEISEAYNSPKYPINKPLGTVLDTIRNLFVCMKGDSKVKFQLDDKDSLVERYSFIAYNGENDTILYREVSGGPDSPTQYFDWICPPERSATPIAFHLDGDKVQLPLSKDYFIDVDILNNGLDSLDDVQLFFKIDNGNPVNFQINYNPVLKYNRKRKQPLGFYTLNSGCHDLTAWTTLPNGQADLLMEDDTLRMQFCVIDTISGVTGSVDSLNSPGSGSGGGVVGGGPELCNNFDDINEINWISANPYTLSQVNTLFEKGAPTKPVINSANSGANAWVTQLDTTYGNLAQGMIISPFFRVVADSCYKVSFMHNYFIPDSLHDGGTVRYLTPEYRNLNNDYRDDIWQPLGGVLTYDTISFNPLRVVPNYSVPIGDTIFDAQNNWYNTRHILSIPDNSRNMGWTGNSGGWKLAESVLRPQSTYFTALMWRFESDGSRAADGWAIDDVCIQRLPLTSCYPVSIPEIDFNKSDIYLGQNIPNPAASSTVIPYYLPTAGEVTFEVINLLGQPVMVETLRRPSGDGILELDINNLSKGIYYYSMTFEGKKMTNKMVISK